MRKPILLFYSTVIAISLILYFQFTVNSNGSGAPSGYSGAPGENNCRSCHNSFALNSGSATASVSTNIPVTGYIGGETYTITLSVAQAGINEFGFEVSSEKANGTNIGTFTISNTTETQIVGSNYVTHKSAGTSGSGSKTWTVDWKAPCAGQGTVTFYAAFNASNSNNASSGDNIYTRTTSSAEQIINSADTISLITKSDIGNNYDGRDLQITFKTSKCESRTSQYRLFAVKSASAGSFTSSVAVSVLAGNYAVVNTGNPNTTRTKNFGTGGRDSDGDLIRNHEPYTIFILSVANSTLVSNDTLFKSAGDITLTSPMVGVTDITASLTGIHGNATDLTVKFKTPTIEIPVKEYKSIVVKSSSAAGFTKQDVYSLNSQLFKTITTGNPDSLLSVPYAAGDKDADGDTLKPSVFYRIFIFTKADSINSLTDTLQMSENEFEIGVPPSGISELPAKNISIIQTTQFIVISGTGDIGKINFRLYSLNGELIKDGPIPYLPYTIDLHDEQTNIGIIQIFGDGVTISKKVIL